MPRKKSERLSQDERKCFDKIFQIVRGENGTLDKLEDLTSSLKALSGALSANRALSPYDDNYKDAQNLLEAFAELGSVINDDWSKIIAYLARARAIKEQQEKPALAPDAGKRLRALADAIHIETINAFAQACLDGKLSDSVMRRVAEALGIEIY